MTTTGKDDYTLLMNEINEIKKNFDEDKYKNLSQEDLNKEFDKYFEKNEKSNKIKTLFKNLYNEKIPKEISIMIIGHTGQGKSTLLNNLFDTDFKVSACGRGTDAQIDKEVDFGRLKIKVIDTVGLGDYESGKKEIDYAHNNKILIDNLKKEGSYIFQVFDFNSIRITNEKTQIENMLKNIDFKTKKEEYLNIIKKISIIFVQANKHINNIQEKKEKIESIAINFRDITNDEEKDKKLKELTELIEDFNKDFESKFEKNKENIQQIIKDYLNSLKINQNDINDILNYINITYAGDATIYNENNTTIKKINPIPNFSINYYNQFDKFIKGFKKDYEYSNWNDNWRFQIFNILMISCTSKYSTAIANAVNDKSNGQQGKSDNGDSNTKSPTTNDFYKKTEEIEKKISEGKQEIIKDIFVGIGSGGSVGGGAYYAGAIAGGPAAIVGGFVGIVCIGLYKYFGNKK